MKLKKIAALALAGVMAVSMLAGCGTKNEDPNPGEGEGTVTTTGYSAKLEDAMDLTDDQAKYISFKDNTADQAILEKAVAGLSTISVKNVAYGFQVATPIALENTQGDQVVNGEDLREMLRGLATDLDVYSNWNVDLGSAVLLNLAEKDTNGKDLRGAALFVVNGGVDTETAMKSVAKVLKTNQAANIESLVKDHTITSTTDGNATVTYNYNYVMSASVVTRALQDNFTGANNTATFILVTTTRTVSQ